MALALTKTESEAATTNLWTNATSSAWGVATNWSQAQPPNASFDFTLITNAGTKVVTIDSNTPSGNLFIRALTLSAPAGSTNTLRMLNLASPFASSSSVLINRGGALVISNATFTAFDTFDVVAGALRMDGGLLDTTPSQVDIRVGRVNAGIGTVLLNGGTIQCFGFRLGEASGSQGVCTINGGTLLTSTVCDLGEVPNSPGTLNLISGQLLAPNDISRIGNLATGTFNQSGGTSEFAFLSIGDNAPGTVNVSGGLLKVTPANSTDLTRVGNFGAGQLNVSGGTVWSLGEFHVADNPGVTAGVLISGGQVIATNGLVAIGRYGAGDLTITNGSAWFTNASVGRHEGATGTLTVQNGASLYFVDDLSIGRFTNSLGYTFVEGGLLSLTNDNIWVGREGTGNLTVSGGELRARALFVGMAEYDTNSPQGTATFSGGVTLLSSNMVVGTSLISTGQVNVTGGVLAVTNAAGQSSIRIMSGSFNLSQGVVATDRLLLTNANGTFSFAGGELSAGAMTVDNGAPFVVGDGIQPATLVLGGGTYSFANGLVISANATVTGCGTIVGPITNSGTLSTNCGSGIFITSLTHIGDNSTVSFTTLNGATHFVEFKDSLDEISWNQILPGVVGNGAVLSVQDTTATNQVRFYRVHIP